VKIETEHIAETSWLLLGKGALLQACGVVHSLWVSKASPSNLRIVEM